MTNSYKHLKLFEKSPDNFRMMLTACLNSNSSRVFDCLKDYFRSKMNIMILSRCIALFFRTCLSSRKVDFAMAAQWKSQSFDLSSFLATLKFCQRYCARIDRISETIYLNRSWISFRVNWWRFIGILTKTANSFCQNKIAITSYKESAPDLRLAMIRHHISLDPPPPPPIPTKKNCIMR